MLIVVSDTQLVKNEANIINALFDQGLHVFHLRKPKVSVSAIQSLLEEINPIHLSKISLHQHHSLAEKVGIKRLHYPEIKRKNSTTEEWKKLKEEDYHLSTSIHQVDEAIEDEFGYAFFGPVFDSLSKKGYTAITNSKFKVQNSKLIAIGGIDENNCTKALEMGFAGVAVLGAIWQHAEPINQFKKIKRKCSLIVQ